MDWTQAIDGYCERTDPSFWSEPVNALTNLAFILAAALLWRRVGAEATGRLLCVILALIGIGSGLFHTFGQVWASMADVLSIVLFVLVYLYAASRDLLGLKPIFAAAITLAFLPYTAALTWVFDQLPFFTISSFYWPLPVLILAYAALLRRSAPQTARGLAIGAGILCLSLTFRSLDEPLCAQIPLGTHFLWHILNGVMLGWMIETRRRHLAGREAPR